MKEHGKDAVKGSEKKESVGVETTDNVVAPKKEVVKKEVPCKDSIGEQEMTASQFATIAGVGVHTMFWVNKTFSSAEMKEANKWSSIFKKEGAIDKDPEVLKEKVS